MNRFITCECDMKQSKDKIQKEIRKLRKMELQK